MLHFQIDFHYETGDILLQKQICSQNTMNHILRCKERKKASTETDKKWEI